MEREGVGARRLRAERIGVLPPGIFRPRVAPGGPAPGVLSDVTERAGFRVFEHATGRALAGAGGMMCLIGWVSDDMTRLCAKFGRPAAANLVGGAGKVAS